ncbi:bifunctional 3,4-dihydroxy-2-butanone-4-phosphate synthase/GTP cyclohydrolase II [Psychrobacter sp. I-STPA10]|uniref:bifunctional 3,4-dihydroxy-2-butanone-4-phosphate synthase/GTP cyclohydrolase II n=1 Tax=Psychrobacter sp. I-STPA10 TaxID=2585769 RepID=UPI001E391831|nr:bifunctional 3,4-dihydroxy-2-butanone-4-phosphate synthase/GTP cyclohydrolase II [Psychrobacter sp. I-STPA10]
MTLNSTKEIIDDIQAGKMVILMDDEDRENEGDLLMAATHVRPEDINFMITHARGLVCLTLTEKRCQRLNLAPMSQNNGSKFGTAFTQSIEAAKGVTTGISAADRTKTIQAAVSATAKAEDIVQPGHIFPIMAQNGGVLHRAGHTEAGCDLTRLAGLEPAAVICEITNADGTMARRDDLEKFAAEHDLKIGTIADLINYRIAHEQTIEEVEVRDFHTDYGTFTLHRFREYGATETHLALVKGEPSEGTSTIRVHGFHPLRDLFAAKHDETGRSGWSVQAALKEISQSDRGVLVWIGNNDPVNLGDTLDKAANNQSVNSLSNQPYRSIGVGAQILRHLGVHNMRLLSSPMKFFALSGFDLNVVEFVEAPDCKNS